MAAYMEEAKIMFHIIKSSMDLKSCFREFSEMINKLHSFHLFESRWIDAGLLVKLDWWQQNKTQGQTNTQIYFRTYNILISMMVLINNR